MKIGKNSKQERRFFRMEFCLDTNVIIELFRGNEEVRKKLEKIQNNYCVTPLVVSELFKGAFLKDNSKLAVKQVEDFVENAGIIGFNIEAAKLFGEKYSELKKKGKMTQEIDLMTGCIALVHNSTIVTRNIKHFENISELKVIGI